MKLPFQCRSCGGSGLTRVQPGACPVCQGAGGLRSVRGHMVFSRSCTSCGGTGQQRPRACDACAGSGQESRTEMVAVRIPAGIADGDRVRVYNQRGELCCPAEVTLEVLAA